jgi:epoxyqueuosine reductase
VKRTGRERFLRNVCVAIGNTGCSEDLPALSRIAESEPGLIAEHARWAITKLQKGSVNNS